MGLLLFFLNILLPYVLYTRLEALTGIRPLYMIHCLPITFLQQGLVQKNQWVCVWRKILVPFSLHVYVYPQNPPSSSLYLTSLTKWETIHTVFGFFVCCCTFNFKPDIFLFLFISFPGLFQTLVSVSSILFLYITLFFSPSSFLTVKTISPCLLTWCIALSGHLLHVEAVFKSLVSSSEHIAAHQLFSY